MTSQSTFVNVQRHPCTATVLFILSLTLHIMNRSLSLLRPLGSRSFVASRLARPTALQPAFTKLTMRAYASKSGSSAEDISKANHHVDNQNATSSAKEEVSLSTVHQRGTLIEDRPWTGVRE